MQRMFLGRKSPEKSFLGDSICFLGTFLGKHNAFGKYYPFWGIAKYQEVLLCAGKVTKEDVKRKV